MRPLTQEELDRLTVLSTGQHRTHAELERIMQRTISAQDILDAEHNRPRLQRLAERRMSMYEAMGHSQTELDWR